MKTMLVMVLLLCPALYAMASPSLPGFGRDAGAPIDGGISLLVAAGIGYGAKKVRDARKKTTQAGKENSSGI